MKNIYNGMAFRKNQLITGNLKKRPHVVILGAGANEHPFPQGDANRLIPPTMDNNFVGVVSVLQDTLGRAGIKNHKQNFELLYSEIYDKYPESSLLFEIEECVRNYFEKFQIRDTPTLYDHLLLSLRPKDLIATFNWDPFLFDAWKRHRHEIPLPKIVYLHGNVRSA